MSRRGRSILVLALGGLLVVLIGGAAALLALRQAQPSCRPAAVSDAVRLAVEPRSDNALIADATVELSSPAAVYLEYGNPQLGWLRTPASAVSLVHRLPIVRLRPQTAYQVRALALDRSGCAATAAVAELMTDRLPAQFQKLVVESSGRPTFPLTLMDLHPPDSALRWLTVVDPDGRVVWYYPTPEDFLPPPPNTTSTNMRQSPPPLDAVSVKQRANGNLVYLAGYYGLEEITPDGRVVHRFRTEDGAASRPHHDLVELPDGRILFIGAEDRWISDSRRGGPPNTLVRGDALQVVNLETGQARQVWSPFDYLDPTERSGDWGKIRLDQTLEWQHTNSVALGPRGNVLLSSRYLNQVISIAPDLESVEWKLGGPGSSFSFPSPEDRFYGQHAVNELANGHLIMFDNGNFRPDGAYSRALELQLDLRSMTARRVWEYRHDSDVYSDRLSNATRLANGNTLVSFGVQADPEAPPVLVEVRPDGAVSWELLLRWTNKYTTRYRAYPLSSLAGETAVEPTPLSTP